MSPKRLGLSIQQLREARGFTQSEFAKKAKVSQPYLSQLEAGTRGEPSVKIVQRIAKALGLSIGELLK